MLKHMSREESSQKEGFSLYWVLPARALSKCGWMEHRWELEYLQEDLCLEGVTGRRGILMVLLKGVARRSEGLGFLRG